MLYLKNKGELHLNRFSTGEVRGAKEEVTKEQHYVIAHAGLPYTPSIVQEMSSPRLTPPQQVLIQHVTR